VKPSPAAEDPLDKLDQLVDVAPEPENAVLTDNARVVRWTGPMFALFAVILLPWTVYLGLTLPTRQVSPNYDAAWAGFDVLLLGSLAATAYAALRRSRYLSTVAAAPPSRPVTHGCMKARSAGTWGRGFTGGPSS
jgi:hypothetical protein